MPSTPFIGVRISWLIAARNSDFAWFDSSARDRAARSSSLARASEAVRSATRRSSWALSSASRRSAALRSAISRGQPRVVLLELPRARHRQQLRHQRPERHRRRQRHRRGADLDRTLHPVVGHPHGPDPEDVGDAAGDDEAAEQVEDPAVADVRPAIGEVDDRERDREVRERDQRVGDQVGPEHVGPPQQAHAVRLETLGREEVPDPDRHGAPPRQVDGVYQISGSLTLD